jgi:prolyl oligopeptidase
MPNLTYPPSPTVEQSDDYHGTRVADPYRWLEDVDSPETRAWIAAQNAVTEAYLAEIPARGRLRQRLTELWNYPRAQAPVKRGGRYLQLRNSGLQNQDVLMVSESLGGEARVLLDPNALSPDGTTAIAAWSVSDNGRYLAYGTSTAGSDWMIWHVREVGTGQDLPDFLEWSKFSGAAWRPDGSGFYYCRYAPPSGQAYTEINEGQQLYFHRLGEAQADDALVYERPDHKDWLFGAEVSEDGGYLVLHVSQGTDSRNRLFYQDLATGGTVELIAELKDHYAFLGNDGPRFYFYTNHAAPRGKIVALDVTRPGREGEETLIAEGEDTLQHALMVHDCFVALYLHDAYHQIRLFERDGTPSGEVTLPAVGSVISRFEFSLSGRRADNELFYSFSSFVYPPTVFRYDFASGQSQPLFAPPIAFDFAAYRTRQVLATSRDGTRVPMFLVHRRDLPAGGNHPTLLYGYGGFNVALTPEFSVDRLAWLEMGGVFALANLRGGSEFGEEWHRAGSLLNKQNVFDDFIACAEHLIATGLTSTPRLAIEGHSNGGLLVGACLTQRPDVFGAALPAVGVMDMLRFHKFTIGWAWVSDYGSPDDPEQFKALLAYSPLHNLRPGTVYPATLVTTADHDDRVVPGHSFKFAAAMQAAQGGDQPAVIRIQSDAGHGAGKPTAVEIAERADVLAFLARALGMTV